MYFLDLGRLSIRANGDLYRRLGLRGRQVDLDDEDYGRRNAANASNYQPTRPVDKERAESDLALSIKKATSPEETAPSKCLSLLPYYYPDIHSGFR